MILYMVCGETTLPTSFSFLCVWVVVSAGHRFVNATFFFWWGGVLLLLTIEFCVGSIIFLGSLCTQPFSCFY